jgi:putative intracellular protease/amidase
MQIAIVLYPGLTALDAVGPYEVLRLLPDAEVRFVGPESGPVVADSGVLFLGATHSYAETPSPDVVLVPGSGPRTAVVAGSGIGGSGTPRSQP